MYYQKKSSIFNKFFGGTIVETIARNKDIFFTKKN